MNAFIENKKENGSVTLDGVEYALIQDAYLSDNGKTYQACAFSESMMDEEGKHQAGFDDTVTLYWNVEPDGNCGEDVSLG